MAVLVLKPFAVQGGAPGGAPKQEALGCGVSGGPDHVADALEAKIE